MKTTHTLCESLEEAEMQSRINKSIIFITTFPDGSKTYSVMAKQLEK